MFPAHAPEVGSALIFEVGASICIFYAHIWIAEIGSMINDAVRLTIPDKLAQCCGAVVGPNAAGNCLRQDTCPSTSRVMDDIVAKTSDRDLAEEIVGQRSVKAVRIVEVTERKRSRGSVVS